MEGLFRIGEGRTEIKAVVCDGHTGLLQAITFCPVQICQFHQLQIVRRFLTNNPHLSASMELLSLVRNMFSMTGEQYSSAFCKWCDEWKDFMEERTVLT